MTPPPLALACPCPVVRRVGKPGLANRDLMVYG